LVAELDLIKSSRTMMNGEFSDQYEEVTIALLLEQFCSSFFFDNMKPELIYFLESWSVT
jgi:hypothetical protein